MSELVIRISDSGLTRVSVDDETIGMISELKVTACEGDHFPKVDMTFPDHVISQSEKLRETHGRYMELLSRIPYVHVALRAKEEAVDSLLVRFFAGIGRDSEGRTLDLVLSKDDSWLERNDDYVQWLLPTRRQSRYCPNAPTLSDLDVGTFSVRPDLRSAYMKAVRRMADFLEIDSPSPFWVRKTDHNHKRISRLIQSLSDLGFSDMADRVLARALDAAASRPGVISEDTVEHWRKARGR